MRLLEITNRDPRKVIPRIVNFPGNCEGLRYAILSHTWREEEVTLQDMERGSGPHMKGYNKIAEFYYRARADGFEYVWIDTCCIDKKDSTELHEAINSMFRWYQEAVVCYAYLDDVDEVADSNSTDSEADPIHPFVREPTPRWFTRGWTLQELLAPKEVEFFDKDWNHMGRRSELKEEISMAAGIDPEALVSRSGTWHQYSVAQRMSWAARRTTTREEDGAYCLMGLFGVNMPLVYGEGSGAFKRLQAEIMALSDDLSIFAWMADKGCHPQLPCSDASGLLAPSPRAFAGCRGVIVRSFPTAKETGQDVLKPIERDFETRGPIIDLHLPMTFIPVEPDVDLRWTTPDLDYIRMPPGNPGSMDDYYKLETASYVLVVLEGVQVEHSPDHSVAIVLEYNTSGVFNRRHWPPGMMVKKKFQHQAGFTRKKISCLRSWTDYHALHRFMNKDNMMHQQTTISFKQSSDDQQAHVTLDQTAIHCLNSPRGRFSTLQPGVDILLSKSEPVAAGPGGLGVCPIGLSFCLGADIAGTPGDALSEPFHYMLSVSQDMDASKRGESGFRLRLARFRVPIESLRSRPNVFETIMRGSKDPHRYPDDSYLFTLGPDWNLGVRITASTAHKNYVFTLTPMKRGRRYSVATPSLSDDYQSNWPGYDGQPRARQRAARTTMEDPVRPRATRTSPDNLAQPSRDLLSEDVNSSEAYFSPAPSRVRDYARRARQPKQAVQPPTGPPPASQPFTLPIRSDPPGRAAGPPPRDHRRLGMEPF